MGIKGIFDPLMELSGFGGRARWRGTPQGINNAVASPGEEGMTLQRLQQIGQAGGKDGMAIGLGGV